MKEAPNRGGHEEKNYTFPLVFYLAPSKKKVAVHILVDGFDVFGVQVQYWMFIAVPMVAVAILFGAWSR
jgi:hypothetical protein